jgi:hypothetical protein
MSIDVHPVQFGRTVISLVGLRLLFWRGWNRDTCSDRSRGLSNSKWWGECRGAVFTAKAQRRNVPQRIQNATMHYFDVPPGPIPKELYLRRQFFNPEGMTLL